MIDRQMDLRTSLEQAAHEGDEQKLMAALAAGASPLARRSRPLDLASQAGHEGCVAILMPLSDVGAGGSSALREAAKNGHEGCVRLLLPASDVNESMAMAAAARNGRAGCLRLVLERGEPLAEDSFALRLAAREGHGECVALLLPLFDPLERGDRGLDAAGEARAQGFGDVASMIEAYVEARELGASVSRAKACAKASL